MPMKDHLMHSQGRKIRAIDSSPFMLPIGFEDSLPNDEVSILELFMLGTMGL